MKESTSPPLADLSEHRNATDLLMHRFRTSPDHVAFEVRASGAPVSDSWQQVTRAAAQRLSDDVGRLADSEGLHAHAAAARAWGQP